jgi:hypothetical protein
MLLLTLSITCGQIVPKVAAPPVGGLSSSGILTSTGSDIKIVETWINISIVSIRYDYYNVHDIQLQGILNMTNPSSKNESILLLYSPSWPSYSSFLNESSLTVYTDVPLLVFSNQTLANVTHPRYLPSQFHDRFPDWVYVHDQLWENSTQFIMFNLTLYPKQSVRFYLQDQIEVTVLAGNLSEVAFGLNVDQIVSDSTRIHVQIVVIDGSQFIDLNPYPNDIVVESQNGDDCTFRWDAQPPLSPQLIYGITPTPICAGFLIQMEVTEYHLPTLEDTTTPSTLSSQSLVDSLPIVALLTIGVLAIVLLVLWRSRT